MGREPARDCVEQAEQHLKRRNETDMIIDSVYAQTAHMPNADFVTRLWAIGIARGLEMPDGENRPHEESDAEG